MYLPIQLDRAEAVPLQDQLFEQMRQLIVSGKIKPNARIIATRFLAEQVGVSRTTVLLVYERLISEGYLKTQPTVGTFVCDTLPDTPLQKKTNKVSAGSAVVRQAQLHPASFDPAHAKSPERHSSSVDFSRLFPDSSLLPTKMWLRSTQLVMERKSEGAADPLLPQGLPVLRQVLADWFASHRGVTVEPEQIVVVSGFRQAFTIISHLFQRRGDHVVVEASNNSDAIQFLKNRQASIIPVPIDHNGIITEHLPEDGAISFACVKPAREDISGGTLPTHRRKRLIDWARRRGTYIVEDDHDSDFRYQGSAPLPLIAHDSYGLVFHVGSFSKTLGAGQSLGYMIAPTEFIDAICAIKAMSDDGRSWIEQRVLAEFIANGSYDHHLRRMRRTLMARRDCLLRTLQAHFGALELAGIESGTQVTWILPPEFPAAEKMRDMARLCGISVGGFCEEKNLGITSTFCSERVLVFSYAALTEGQIKDGIARLAKTFKLAHPSFPLVTEVVQKGCAA